MTDVILYKLLAIFLMVASGWVATQLGWLGKAPSTPGQALDGSSQAAAAAAGNACLAAGIAVRRLERASLPLEAVFHRILAAGGAA